MSAFVSYQRQNQDAVQLLVKALRHVQIPAWWDQDIAPDDPWEATIERQLHAAKVVIVCWSPEAVASENVKAEARWARDRGKLIQVFVAPCEPPLFFGERQGVDLSQWNGATGDNRFQTVLTAVRAILAGKAPREGVGYAPAKRRPWAAITAGVALLAGVLALISDAAGARDAACGWSALKPHCLRYGLIATPIDPEVARAAAEAEVLTAMSGEWANALEEPLCARRMTIAVSRGDDGVDRVRVTGPEPTHDRTLMAEVNLDRRAVMTESPDGTFTEFLVHGDRMDVRGAGTNLTPLTRCR